MPPENTGIQNVRVRSTVLDGPRSSSSIQNVQATEERTSSGRFENKLKLRGLQADLWRRRKKILNNDANNTEDEYEPDQARQIIAERALNFLSDEIRNELENETDDISLEIKNPPTAPSFPFIILSLAIIKDLLDFILITSVFFAVLAMAFSLIIAVILFFWMFGKMSGKWWKKRILKGLWTRYIVSTLIEITPFLGIFPATTIFVLMAHYHETKIVRNINKVLEEIRTGGVSFT